MSLNPTEALTDADVEFYIRKLKRVVQQFAEKHDLWHDCGFRSWASHFGEEPEENPCVLVLCTEGGLCRPNDGEEVDWNLDDHFRDMVSGLGFICEDWDHCVRLFYAEDERLKVACRRYFEWKWICNLIAPDYSELYEEIFSHIANDADRLHELTPRQFEEFLDVVFRNQGYDSHLGPGTGDGGIDLRLYHKDAIGDMVTLVQAKRYSRKHPIRLEAVSALTAHVDDQKANRGLFVTTSRFLPGVKEFASKQLHRIELATSADVARWCEDAAHRIIRDKSELVSDDSIRSIARSVKVDGTDPRIVSASWGYNCTLRTCLESYSCHPLASSAGLRWRTMR